MKEEIKCPICGHIYLGESFDDCPVCDWEYTGTEEQYDENEYNSPNHMTIKQAKENFSKGLNIWGEPLSGKSFSIFKNQ